MICNWVTEKISFDEKYYNILLKPDSIYQNSILDTIERSGFLRIFKTHSPNKVLPLALSKILKSPDGHFYFTQTKIKEKKSSRTIVALSSLISSLSQELMIDELKRIKASTEGEIFLYVCDSWDGQEGPLLQILNVFMVVFGYVPKAIEFQTIGWSTDLKDSSFYLLGQRWFISDSYFQHMLLSKGAREILLHPLTSGKIIKEVKISQHHSMYLAKIEQYITSVDYDDLMTLQKLI